MSGFLDECTCRACCCGCCCEPLCDKLEEIDWSMKRNALASVAAGVLFFSGWWIMIDMAAVSTTTNAYFAIGVGSTVAFFMVNAVSASQLDNDLYEQGCLSGHIARLWLFFGFLLTFSALVGCSAVLYIEVHNHENLPPTAATTLSPVTTANGTMNTTAAAHPILAGSVSPTTSTFTGTVPNATTSYYSPPTKFERLWPGIAIFLQNIFIFFATMVFKFGRSEEMY